MNQQLSNIELLIQQSSLPDEEKQKLLKEISTADKHWNILEFKLDQPPEKVKKTTAVLLEETIEELRKKRKDVEAQNRKLEVDAAVERVRAKALAMHKSAQVLEVVIVLKAQLKKLGLTTEFTGATIFLQQGNGSIRMWDLTSLDAFQKSFDVVFLENETPADLYFMKMWRSKESYNVMEQDKNDLQLTVDWLKQYDKKTALELEELIHSNNLIHSWHPAARLKHGWLCVDLDQQPSAEFDTILPKMAAAFDLAYTRFLDLQKAEAQAREAEIELGLERVRARAMAMQTSEELNHLSELYLLN